MQTNTTYKKLQGEKQASLIEKGSPVFYGAKNRGLASWFVKGSPFPIKKPSRNVLLYSDKEKNLFEPIRSSVLSYMKEEGILWWKMPAEVNTEVTAHILSSQVCCLNHLFLIRNDEKAIKKILYKATGIDFDEIIPSIIDHNSLISFEFVLKNKSLLNENTESRGKNCTSIDALVYAKKGNDKWLIPIEWKYTEAYLHDNKVYNFNRYKEIWSKSSRITSWNELFKSDPFYELGRQTLLMEKIIEDSPNLANNFFHIVVIPKGNVEMRNDANLFRNSLKEEHSDYFSIIDPEDLMTTLETDYPDLISYLRTRYW